MQLIKILIFEIQIALSSLKRPTVWPWPLTTGLPGLGGFFPLYVSHVYAVESIRNEAPCHNWCGTIKIPRTSCSKALSADRIDLKFAALHKQWWLLYMSEIVEILECDVKQQTNKNRFIIYLGCIARTQ